MLEMLWNVLLIALEKSSVVISKIYCADIFLLYLSFSLLIHLMYV